MKAGQEEVLKQFQENPRIAPVILSFGECTLNTAARQLTRAGQDVRLNKKAYELLLLLLDERPRVVAKTELMERLWPDTFVSEANIAVHIGDVRTAIGDSAKTATLIRTHSGVGYSFVGSVTEALRPGDMSAGGLVPVLTVGARRILLPEGTTTIGRDPSCGVTLAHPSVSRVHAKFVVKGQTVTVEDLGSKNGTLVNGRGVQMVTPLSQSDTVTCGSVECGLAFQDSGGSTLSLKR